MIESGAMVTTIAEIPYGLVDFRKIDLLRACRVRK